MTLSFLESRLIELENVSSSSCDSGSSSLLEFMSDLYSEIQNSSSNSCPYLDLLSRGVLSSNFNLALSSLNLLFQIQKTKSVSPFGLLQRLLSRLSNSKSPQAIVRGIGLCLNNSSISYSIASNEHPYITILRANPSSWPFVLDLLIQNEPSPIPVMYFILVQPNYHSHFGQLRSLLRNHLLNHSSNPKIKSFLLNLPKWIKSNVYENQKFLLQIYQITQKKDRIYEIFSTAIQCNRIGGDFKPYLKMATELVSQEESFSSSVCPFLLAVLFQESCFYFYEDILDVFLFLNSSHPFDTGAIAFFVTKMLVPSLYPSKLLKSEFWSKAGCVLKLLSEIIPRIDTSTTSISTDSYEIKKAYYSNKLISSLIRSSEAAEKWIRSRKVGNDDFSIGVASSLLLVPCKYSVLKKLCEYLIGCAEEDPSFSQVLLPVFLRAISAEKNSLKLQYLFEALPRLATDKRSVKVILSVVDSLSTVPSLVPLRLMTLYRLWLIEERSYVYLHKALEKNDFNSKDVELTKVLIIKYILENSKTNQHSQDLLPFLSQILNSSDASSYPTASVMALDCLSFMVKEFTIDIVTTVKVIRPKVLGDGNPLIEEAFARLISLAPGFGISSPQYMEFTEEILEYLWNKVLKTENLTLRLGIVKALSAFQIGSHSINHLPTPVSQSFFDIEEELRPDYIPGTIWIDLLEFDPDLFEVFFQNLISNEVRNLLEVAYHQVSPEVKLKRGDSKDYTFLPKSSVLRYSIKYLLSDTKNTKVNKIIIKALRNQNSGRLLPPLNWDFLSAYSKYSYDDIFALMVAQSANSDTARLYVENALAMPESPEMAYCLFENLDIISQTSSAESIESFLELAFNQFSEDFTSLEIILNNLNSSISKMKTIPSFIVQFIEKLSELLFENNDRLFDLYVETVCKLPFEVTEQLSNPNLWVEITEKGFKRSIAIRQRLASNNQENPLVYFNDLIDNLHKTKGIEVLFESMEKIFFQYRGTKTIQSFKNWLLDLMGQIKIILRQNKNGFENLMDIFFFIIIYLSQVDAWTHLNKELTSVDPKLRKELFPIALGQLLKNPELSNIGSQLGEWLLSLFKYTPIIPSDLREICKDALSEFKCHECYSELWSKLVVQQ